MKRIIALLIVLALFAALGCSCGSKDETSSAASGDKDTATAAASDDKDTATAASGGSDTETAPDNTVETTSAEAIPSDGGGQTSGADVSADESADKTADKTSDVSADESADKTADKTSDVSADKTADKTSDVSADESRIESNIESERETLPDDADQKTAQIEPADTQSEPVSESTKQAANDGDQTTLLPFITDEYERPFIPTE